MPMIETLCFFGRIRKNALTFVRKREIYRGRNFLANRSSTFNFLANALDRRMISQETIGQILIFPDQAQQQVLGFNRRATELARFVASEEYDPPCSLSVSFEHNLLILSVATPIRADF